MARLNENEKAMKVLDLFSGIGGFSLGLEMVAKLKALGNAVVPQIPEAIGKAIMRG